MARNYRTASAAPLDYMYSINAPLMERALLANDKFINENLATTQKLGELAHYNYLQGDEADATAITNAYVKQIDDVAGTIRNDPANWRKQLEPIRDIRRKLQQDYTTGAISKQVANYNKRAADFKAIDDQVKLYHTSGGTKGVDPTRAALAKQHIDSKFDKTGYDPATGNYNQYRGGSIMDNINVRKRLDDIAKEVKETEHNVVEETLKANGAYFDKETHKWKGIKPEKLLEVITSAAQSDTQLQQYLGQEKEIGSITGDINPYLGQPDSPFSIDSIPISPEEQTNIDNFQAKMDATKDAATKAKMKEQLDAHKKQLENRSRVNYNDKNYLAPIMRGIVAERAYEKTSDENDLSNNSLFNTQYTTAHADARTAATLKQSAAIAQANFNEKVRQFDITQKNINDRFEKTLKQKEEAAAAKGTGKIPGTSIQTKTKTEPIPLESDVEKVATNSFEGITVDDINGGGKVKLFSNAGLSSDIVRKKRELESIDRQLNTVNSVLTTTQDANLKNQLKAKQESLQKQAKLLESDLNNRRLWYQKSSDAAQASLSSDELALYKKYPADKAVEQLRQEVENTRKKYPGKASATKALGFAGTDLPSIQSTTVDSPETNAANEKLQKYIAIKKKVDSGRESFLTEVRKDNINEDGIKVGSKDSAGLQDLILNTSRGAQLLGNTGEHTDGIEIDAKGVSWFDPKGDNYNLSFANNSLQDYIAKSGTEMVVKHIAPTTAIGNGNAVVEVQFKDPQGQIPSNKSYYINASPAMQKALATKFKRNKNPEIASIGANLDDDLANSVRNQLARPQTKGEEQKFTITIPDNANQPQPVTVVAQDGHLFVTTHGADGEEGLPSLSGIGGDFNGPAELIASIKKIKTLTREEYEKVKAAKGNLLVIK